MKKVFFIAILSFLATTIFAIELWNGFTSGSSKQEVINRAREILSVTKSAKTDNADMGISGQDNNGYPRFERVCLYSPLSIYSQESWSKDSFGNILAYFYDNKLFSIGIVWAAEREDVLNIARRQYGNPTRTLIEEVFFSNRNVFFWQLSGRDFFVDGRTFYIVDRTARENWIAEQRRLQQQRNAEEEARRRSAADGIVF